MKDIKKNLCTLIGKLLRPQQINGKLCSFLRRLGMTKGESQRGRCVEIKVSVNDESMAANWAVDRNTKQKSNVKFQLQVQTWGPADHN